MDLSNFENIDFNLPKHQSNVIKVIGVGGGGSNAVNYMYQKGIQGVDFVVTNTDAQALSNSSVPVKIQLGADLTEGLGAGADPEVGERSALESKQDIINMLGEKTKMVFITVGMGGGTGTGAAPVIAKIAKDMGLLTVGIVTIPFSFEGKTRNDQAQKGIDKLKENVDSIIVINNNKLREVYGNLGYKSGFAKADEVLSTAACGIANVITNYYTQNIDFKDAKTVLTNSGSAIMGSASASGSNRAQEAIVNALESPLLNDNKIAGAKNVLLLIVSGTSEITIDEIGEINDYIQSEAKTNVNIIMGVGEDESLGESVEVTIVATGFNIEQQTEFSKIESKRVIFSLDDNSPKLESTFISKPTNVNQINSVKEIKPAPRVNKIVHKLEEEDNKPLKVNLFDIDVNDIAFISKKSVKDIEDDESIGFLPKELTNSIHQISNDIKVSESSIKNVAPIIKNELVATTPVIEGLEVNYELINSHDDFIITPATNEIEVIDHVVVKANEIISNQIEMAFDLPLEQIVKKTPVADLEEAKQIEVVDTEIVSKNKVYSLEDYIELENTLETAKPIEEKKVEMVQEIDKELVIKSRIVENITEEVVSESIESTEIISASPMNSAIEEVVKSKKRITTTVSPMNSTIDELKTRANDRRKHLGKHNYNFSKSTKQNIDDLEKQPAYKRKNVEIDTKIEGNNTSRTTLNMNDNEINFRSNNSFLHDTVD